MLLSTALPPPGLHEPLRVTFFAARRLNSPQRSRFTSGGGHETGYWFTTIIDSFQDRDSAKREAPNRADCSRENCDHEREEDAQHGEFLISKETPGSLKNTRFD